jgi:hypothetical protein
MSAQCRASRQNGPHVLTRSTCASFPSVMLGAPVSGRRTSGSAGPPPRPRRLGGEPNAALGSRDARAAAHRVPRAVTVTACSARGSRSWAAPARAAPGPARTGCGGGARDPGLVRHRRWAAATARRPWWRVSARGGLGCSRCRSRVRPRRPARPALGPRARVLWPGPRTPRWGAKKASIFGSVWNHLHLKPSRERRA